MGWDRFLNMVKAHMKPKTLTTAEEITQELNASHFEITDFSGFKIALEKAKESNSPLYWGYYKLVNK